jgi:tetratricopeptide (TPR) repeat protein
MIFRIIAGLTGDAYRAPGILPRQESNAPLGNLGNAYAKMGETRRAADFYQQYLEIAREIGDRKGEGTALGNLGVAYKNLGEARRASGYIFCFGGR